MKRIAYLTLPSFFDLDISLIRELSKVDDVYVIEFVSNHNNHLSAFDVDDIGDTVGLFNFSEVPETTKYANLIDMNKWFMAINPADKKKGNLQLAMQVVSFLRQGHFDVIHTTSDSRPMLLLYPYILFHKHSLLTVHDPIPHNAQNRISEYVKRNIGFGLYRNLLLLSKSLESDFIERYPIVQKKCRLYYSRLGVYDYLTSYPVSNNEYGKYILFHGRITEYKGVDLLIESYYKSDAFYRGVKLVIAGPGNIRAANMGDDSIVIINRYIQNHELASLIANCLFTVLPYRSATQSGVLMASFAFGKPALVTDVGDFPDSVIEGRYGKVIKHDDCEALRLGLNDMVSSNLSSMENNIISDFSHGYKSWQSIAVALDEVYDSLSK